MSKKYTIIFLCFFMVLANLKAEYSHSCIDTVYSFIHGQGQNTGQDSAYFPQNIFGLPTAMATDYIPASTADEVCSLGLNGEITVGFKNYIISDGEGPDFTIFENVFIMAMLNKKFVEPAQVSVSQDGINFIAFPFDSLTLKGCAGTEPTNGNKYAFDPTKSGGDTFDLKTVGLTWAKYIRIKDVSQFVLANPKHPFYNASITGFDLDAVVGINLTPTGTQKPESITFKSYNRKLSIDCNNFKSVEYSIFNVLGAKLLSGKNTAPEIDLSELNSGVYLIRLSVTDANNNIHNLKESFYTN